MGNRKLRIAPYKAVGKRSEGPQRRLHSVIAERALGRRLKGAEQVHHVDGNSWNNENSNLVICPNMEYHKLLHMRTAALEACGNPNWVKCSYCKKYDAPEALYIRKGGSSYHRECRNEHLRDARK